METLAVTSEESPFDVLIVGAGLAGIGAACWLQKELPNKRYAILEARQAIGGTWDLFRYPGVRCDSDMYTLGYSFKPWRQPKSIVDGDAIRQYIEEAAGENGIVSHIRFGHNVIAAAWSTSQACWTLEVEQGSIRHTLRTRFLYMCSGYYKYDQPYRPRFSGENDFEGEIVLPQFWPEKLNYTGKQVVVVGSGATAMTLVPAMASAAAQVTLLQRSPSYVVPLPAQDKLSLRLQRWLPSRLAYSLVRWKNIVSSVALYWLARNRPERVKQQLLGMVSRRLGRDYDVNTHFSPRYNPWDQRMCVVPDGDLFKAIRKGRATVVTDEIEQFTPHGLQLKSGQQLPADIVVLATGLTIQLFGGMQLTIDGQPVQPNQLMAYKGMMLSDVPNMAFTFGYTNASWTLKADLTASYVCRLLRYMDRHEYAIAVPRPQAGITSVPFVDLTSGYVQRARQVLPRQGARRPWQVYQNYLRDRLTIRLGRLADGVMEFNPKPTTLP